MFEGKLCKKTAKRQLKGRWKGPVILTLITTLITGCLYLPGWLVDSYTHPSQTESLIRDIANLVLYCVNAAISLALSFYYLHFSRTPGHVGYNQFFRGLEHWFKATRASLWYWLWVTLWSLLFIIPGIIKAISYSQMFFIIADHPKVGVLKAMKISKVMTRGYKGDLFLLALSFLGWLFLCCLTFGIGLLWLSPYATLSFTNAYRDLKNRALQSGVLNQSDFE